MRIATALILLTGPPLWLLVHYVREYGLTFRKEDGWGVFPVLAVILLLAHVAVLLSAEAGKLLNAEFFPFKGFLFFLVSGVAFSVAIFPKLVAESTDPSQIASTRNLKSLVAVPAWIWILVVILLAILKYAN